MIDRRSLLPGLGMSCPSQTSGPCGMILQELLGVLSDQMHLLVRR
jgi:hypothetical protein